MPDHAALADARSTPRREKERAQSDRATLYDVLDASLVCHLGVVVDGVPLALPTVFAVDPDGPDEGGTLYVHGSVASRSLVQGPGAGRQRHGDRARRDRAGPVRLQPLDELPLRRGDRPAPAWSTDEAERSHALDLLVDHVTPGRSAALRRPTRKELAATTVLALPLHEASVKRRAGDPLDEDVDVEAGGVWAGVVPLRRDGGRAGDRRPTWPTCRRAGARAYGGPPPG